MIAHSQQKVKNISRSSQNLVESANIPQIFICNINTPVLKHSLNYSNNNLFNYSEYDLDYIFFLSDIKIKQGVEFFIKI